MSKSKLPLHRDFGYKYNPSIENYTHCFRIGNSARKVIAISQQGVDISFSDQYSIEICLHLEPDRALEIAKAVLKHLPRKSRK